MGLTMLVSLLSAFGNSGVALDLWNRRSFLEVYHRRRLKKSPIVNISATERALPNSSEIFTSAHKFTGSIFQERNSETGHRICTAENLQNKNQNCSWRATTETRKRCPTRCECRFQPTIHNSTHWSSIFAFVAFLESNSLSKRYSN